jgi:hypothetical protein
VIQLIVGVLLAAGAVYFVLRPIFRPELAGDGRREAEGADEGGDPDDDLSPQAVALRALKEIEFDRATGKLSDADYELLKGKYTEEALAALRAGGREQGAGSREQEAQAPRSLLPAPSCLVHGPRPESDALFCSECGRRLASAPGFCARCGTSLEREAKYCHACGARVAA